MRKFMKAKVSKAYRLQPRVGLDKSKAGKDSNLVFMKSLKGKINSKGVDFLNSRMSY